MEETMHEENQNQTNRTPSEVADAETNEIPLQAGNRDLQDEQAPELNKSEEEEMQPSLPLRSKPTKGRAWPDFHKGRIVDNLVPDHIPAFPTSVLVSKNAPAEMGSSADWQPAKTILVELSGGKGYENQCASSLVFECLHHSRGFPGFWSWFLACNLVMRKEASPDQCLRSIGVLIALESRGHWILLRLRLIW
jgi:hypothetical protein